MIKIKATFFESVSEAPTQSSGEPSVAHGGVRAHSALLGAPEAAGAPPV